MVVVANILGCYDTGTAPNRSVSDEILTEAQELSRNHDYVVLDRTEGILFAGSELPEEYTTKLRGDLDLETAYDNPDPECSNDHTTEEDNEEFAECVNDLMETCDRVSY